MMKRYNWQSNGTADHAMLINSVYSTAHAQRSRSTICFLVHRESTLIATPSRSSET